MEHQKEITISNYYKGLKRQGFQCEATHHNVSLMWSKTVLNFPSLSKVRKIVTITATKHCEGKIFGSNFGH